MNPKNNATPKLFEELAIKGSTRLLNTDPSLEIVMFSPSANASSFPKNHQLTTTV